MRGKWTLLLALLLLLCACMQKPHESDASESPQTGQDTTQQQATDPDEAEPEPLDYDTIALAGGEGFYDLTALPQLDGLTISEAALCGETQAVLLTGSDGATIQLLDLETGQLQQLCRLERADTQTADEEDVEQESDAWFYCSLVCADPLIVAESGWEAQYIRIEWDGTMTQLPTKVDGAWMNYYSAAFTDQCIYYYQDGSGTAYQLSYDGQEQREIGRIPAEYLYVQMEGLDQTGTQLVFQAETAGEENLVTLTMDRSDGTLTGVYQGRDCVKALLSGTQMELEYLSDGTDGYTLTAWAQGEQVSADFDLAWLADSDEPEEEQSSWLAPPKSGTAWGKSLVQAWDGRGVRLLLWDYQDQQAQAAPVELTEYVWPVYDLGELTERAQEMEETYGVRIFLGEEAEYAPFPDYSLTSSEELWAISDALDVVETALGYYPEGYLEQLGGDSVRDICFYLCGRMTPLDASVSIDDPGGLSCQVDNLELLAFNVEYIRVQDVVHELTHVLDHWLWEEGTLDETVWNSFNPTDFSYYYAYVDENGQSYELSGSTKYTTWDQAWYSGDVDSVYFIDPYSTTFPTEDRARLMEYLLANSWGVPDSSFASSHLQAKLSYYFQCIRDTFDTTGWPEQTSWEQALSRVAS